MCLVDVPGKHLGKHDSSNVCAEIIYVRRQGSNKK